MHEQVRSAKLVSRLSKDRGYPQHVITPGSDALFGQVIEIEFKIAWKFFGVNHQFVVRARRNRHISREANGRGHHVAVVVVGVIADQINAAGRAENPGLSSEYRFEESVEIDFVHRLHPAGFLLTIAKLISRLIRHRPDFHSGQRSLPKPAPKAHAKCILLFQHRNRSKASSFSGGSSRRSG